MQTPKIRVRIALPFVILFFVVLGAILIFVNNHFETHLLLMQEEALTIDVSFVNGLLRESEDVRQLAGEVAEIWADENGRDEEAVRLSVFDVNGNPLGDSQADVTMMENHADRPEFLDAVATGFGKSVRFSRTLGREMMYVCVPAVNAAGDVVAYTRMAISIDAIQADVAQMRNSILLGFLGAFAMVFVISIYVSSFIAGPIRSLTKKANLLAQGDMNQKLLVGNQASSEVYELALALNTMAEMQLTQIRTMQAEQDKLAAILSQISDGVMIVDQDGLVELINEACEPLFGAPMGPALGKPLIQVVRHHQYVDVWHECLETGEEQSVFVELPQSEQFIQCIATPLSGDLAGRSMLLIRDLTTLRRLQTVRRDFISNISHELRTPLAALKLLAETVADSAMDDPEMMQYFLQRMQVEVDSLTQMVSELLELARIESGKTPLQLKACDALGLLESVEKRMHVLAENNEIEMTIEIEDDVPDVLVDSVRLGQVFANLVSNALKFTPEGGKVMLGADIWDEDDSKVCFYVTDTGEGIPHGLLERVFERFFKTDQSRSKGGTGLGLSIAKHLVEAHGGRIWAESQEGHGSTFYFTVPRA